jgi:LPS sulfotransferase NodH
MMNRPELLGLLEELDIRKTILSRPGWRLICDDPFCELFASWDIPADQIVNLKLLGRTLQSGRYDGELAIVCVAGEEALYKRILREHQRPCLGLFNDLVLRLAAMAPPGFSDDDYATPGQSYGIFCLPRAGSTLLARELSSAGVGAPAEHFRDHIAYLLQHRKFSNFSIHKWWSVLERAQTRNGIFATKIVWDLYRTAADYMTGDERNWLEAKFGEMTIVYLERRDKVGQAVSDFIAQRTGVWHMWPQYLPDYHEKISRVREDMDAMVVTYRKFTSDESTLKAWLGTLGKPPLEIEFDEVAHNPRGVVRALAEKLNFAPQEDYGEAPLSLSPTHTPLHAEFADKLRERLASTGEL